MHTSYFIYVHSLVVKIRNNLERVLNTPILDHHTDHGPLDLGQYNSLGVYCSSHTPSSVFLIPVMRGYWEDTGRR